MKKAGIFAAVIAVLLLFMQLYNYKLVGYTQDAIYLIDETRAAKNLKNGVKNQQESPDLKLKEYEASAPLYTRGDSYFVGKTYEPLSASYPVYVNEGSFLYNFSNELTLIAADFTELETYDGLYVAQGHTYNRDRQQADGEEFIFMRNPEGLFLNVQDMEIRSHAQKKRIPANSLMYLTKDSVSWYEFWQGIYHYEQYKDVLQAQVTIGSLSISYDELLALLLGEDSAIVTEEAYQGIPAGTGKPDQEGDGDLSDPQQMETLAEDLGLAGRHEGERPGTEAPEGEAFEFPEASDSSTETEAAGEKEEHLPEHPPIPGDNDRYRFPGGSNSEEDAGNGSHGGQEDGNDGSGQNEGGNAGDGGGGQGDSGEYPFIMPKVTVQDFVFDVYSATAKLSIDDPSMSILKGVRLVFYKKGEARASYRKLFTKPGDILLQPLEPDTAYEVEGYFDYEHPQYGKQREIFLERTLCGKTLPISSLTPLIVSQSFDTEALEPNTIQIKNLSLSGKQATASYISSVQMNLKKQGALEWGTVSAALGSSQTAQLKRGETLTWKTAEILESDSRYDYELFFFDRFGNALPVASGQGDKTTGEARTCKQAPSARLRIDPKSSVSQTILKVNIENPDKAAYTQKPYLYVTYANMPETALPFTLKGSNEELTRYELKGNEDTLTFTSLLPSTVYTIWVKAGYDTEDGKSHENQVLGSAFTTTDSLSSLGSVSFDLEAADITSSSATVTGHVRTLIVEALYPFISKLEVAFTEIGKTEPFFKLPLNRTELLSETILPGGTKLLKEAESSTEGPSCSPEISLYLPEDASGEKTLWDALLTQGIITLEFKEGSLHSADSYEVSIRTKALQAGNDGTAVEEDVTGRYYKAAFRTLKQAAALNEGLYTSYINGNSATFYGLKVIDPDGAVLGGKMLLRLRNASNGALLEVRPVTVEEMAASQFTRFQNLEENVSYTLEVVASEYNEGYTAEKETQKLIGTIDFRTENRLSGTLVMDSVDSSFMPQDAAEGFGIDSRNLFDLNSATLDYKITSNDIAYDTSYFISDYIPVEKDTTYILGGGLYAQVAQYDGDKNLISVVNASGNFSYNRELYYQTRDKVSYIRVYSYDYYADSAFVSRMLFSEPDSAANLVRNADIQEGVRVSGNSEITDEKGASTGFISVKPGQLLVRANAASESSNGNYRGLYFYDEKKQYINYSTPDGRIGIAVVPEGAAYVRLNMSADYKDRLYLGRCPKSHYGANLVSPEVNPGLTWTSGYYGDARNQMVKKPFDYYKYSDYIPVEGSALYYFVNLYEGVQVFDSEKEFLGYYDNTLRQAWLPKEAAYVRVNMNFGADNSRVPELRQLTPAMDLNTVTVGVQVTFDDPDKRLGENPFFTLEFTKTDGEGNKEHWSEDYPVDPETRHYEGIVYLDEASTAADSGVIKSEAGILAARYSPMDDYVVVKDITVNSDYAIFNFYGKLDFQGHQVTMKNHCTLISYLMEGAVLENLVADIRMEDSLNPVTNRGMLTTTNWGTMQNVVFRASLDNHQNNYYWGGLSYQNYGLIDSFAIQLTGDVYSTFTGGLAAGMNCGQISNGYALNGEGYKVTLDLDKASAYSPVYAYTHTSRGGLVGSNEGGTLKNLYSTVSMEDIYSGTYTPSQHTQGMVAGYTTGQVKNIFGVGMILENGVPSATLGPALGNGSNASSLNQASNISYVDTYTPDAEHPVGSYYKNSFNNRATAMSLWNREWMESAINEDGAFKPEMAEEGFYPQLIMPSCMEGKQPVGLLPERQAASIKLLSNQILDQQEESALVRFYFENKSHFQIKSLELAVMDLVSGSRTYTAPAARTEIIDQGIDDMGRYYADVKVDEPVFFRSKYYVNKITAGLSGNDTIPPIEVEEQEQGKMEVNLEFFREITTIAQWRDEVCKNTSDMYGNYRLKTEVMDFGQLSPADIEKEYRIKGNFYGIIDGKWKDESGQYHTTLLQNIHLENSGRSLIYRLYGTLRNLKVESLIINREKEQNREFQGLIRELYGTVDSVEIENAEVYGNYMAGILTAFAGNGSVIQNCSVRNSSLKTYLNVKDTQKIRAGGLAGYAGTAKLRNCYVRGLMLDNMEALDNEGVGGLVGYASQTDIRSCYAEGRIHCGFRNAGGLIGKRAGSLSVLEDCYSKVDIDAYGSFVGGLVGYMDSHKSTEGNLSLGNLFVHSTAAEGVHRLMGYSPAEKYLGNFGYEAQMVNNQVDPSDADDGEAVLTYRDLSSSAAYKNSLKWSSEDYELSWADEGSHKYLPLLYSTEGELLPGQEPIPLHTDDASLNVESFVFNQKAGDQCFDWFGHKNITEAYSLRFVLRYDKSKYEVAETDSVPEISMAGMKLNSQVLAADGTYKKGCAVTPTTDAEGSPLEIWEFPFVQTELGGDIYCLKVTLRSKENPSLRITLSATAAPTGGIKLQIANAAQWQEVMAKYGNTYGNFELTGDIDLNTIPDDELITGIKLNSLTSVGGPEGGWRIKGIRHEVENLREAFIDTCLSGISNVTFEDCEWKIAETDKRTSHENIGLIGINQGVIENVSFKDITIRSGLGNYTGCVAYNLGEIQDVTLTDIKVYGNIYTGGLSGYSLNPVKRITAKGTLKYEGEHDYSSSYEVQGTNQVGGIIGHGILTDSIQVSGIKVTGTGNGVRHIGGAVGYGQFIMPEETNGASMRKASLVADTFVTVPPEEASGSQPTSIGGVMGAGYNHQYFIFQENTEVYAPTAIYAGGITGSGYLNYCGARSVDAGEKGYTLKKASVTAGSYAGGVTGSNGGTQLTAENMEVTALTSGAGGLVGINDSGISHSLADRLKVSAPVMAGGIVGECRQSINDCLTARSEIEANGSYAGGVYGKAERTLHSISYCGVADTAIKAGADQETGESFAGGLGGSDLAPLSIYKNYLHKVQVEAEGDKAGGLFGSISGGSIYDNAGDDKTTVTGKNHVGGLAGQVISRRVLSGDYQNIQLYNSYSAVTVKGSDDTGSNYIGGLVGSYVTGDGAAPGQDNVRGLVMMGAVTGNADTSDLILNMADGSDWSSRSLRVFTEATLNGKRAAEMTEQYPNALESFKTAALGGTIPNEEADTEVLYSTLLVTDKDLRDERIYKEEEALGGMKWLISGGNNTWNYKSLGRMDAESEANVTHKSSAAVTVSGNGQVIEGPVGTGLIDAASLIGTDKEKPPVAKIEMEADKYYWYKLYQAKDTGRVQLAAAAGDSLPLAGRGYYMGYAVKDGVGKFTAIIKVDTDSYMPFIWINDKTYGRTLSFQEGFPSGLGENDPLWVWDEGSNESGSDAGYICKGYYALDDLFYGGVVIPKAGTDQSQTLTLEGELSPVTLYPSGADTINLELNASYEAYTGLKAVSGGVTLCDTVPKQRVYTLPYDYRSPVTVTVSTGADSQTLTFDASSLRRTVMTFGDNYYYTCGGQLMDKDGLCLEEEIIHLWGGEALSVDGKVYELSGSLEASGGELAVKPFWQDETLKTFGSFTEVNEGEAPFIQEQQLVRKNGELFALTGEQSLKGMVLDSYNGEVYASFLNESGRLTDGADRLHTPKSFNRSGIAHMSSTLDCSEPYVLVRYENGIAKGFNYVTGEELAVENALTDVSLLDFAAGFTDEFFGREDAGALEFVDLKKLENQLLLRPITDEQLEDARNRLEATAEGAISEAESEAAEGAAEPEGGNAAGDAADAVTENKAEADSALAESKAGADGVETDGALTGNNAGADGTLAEDKAGDGAENAASEEKVKAEASEGAPHKELSAEADASEDKEASAESEASSQDGDSMEKKTEAEDIEDIGKEPKAPSDPKEEEGSAEGGGSEKPEKSKTGETAGSPEGRKPESSAGKPAQGRSSSYTYAFNTKDGTSRLYRSEDLLSKSGDKLMDEEEKLELMKAAGIINEDHAAAQEISEEESKQGILMFSAAVCIALGLSAYLIYRKRR